MNTKLLWMLVLFISIRVHAQDERQPNSYRLIAFQLYDWDNNDNSPIRETDWQKRNIVVVVNFDKNKVHTYGNHEEDIDLIRQTNNETKDNGDLNFDYEGVTDEGEKCNVNLYIFKHPTGIHVATLILNFIEANHSIAFRLKKDN